MAYFDNFIYSNLEYRKNQNLERFPSSNNYLQAFCSTDIKLVGSFEYTSYNRFAKDVRRLLRKYNVSEINITKFIKLFHNDLNSLDFEVNVIGKRKGIFDLISINEIEEIALARGDLNKLYLNKYLYEYEQNDPEIIELKKKLQKRIALNTKISDEKKKIINAFSRKRLKPFIMNINPKFDSQLVMEGNKIVPENTYLGKVELNQIFIKVKILITKYVDIIYFAAYWKSLNQQVLERYN
ncbi:MAG: hypothetical protein PT956_04720 [Firmicutes bacterium]|nr:hypothetical protein [Bacillota bacterium]